MTTTPQSLMPPAASGDDEGRFVTLTFRRDMAAPLAALWQAWTAPSARAIWSAPDPSVNVEFIEANTRIGGREVSICKVEGQADIRCECGWLDLQIHQRSVNYELVSSGEAPLSAALVTADFSGTEAQSHLRVTVQLSSLAEDMASGYQQGFDAGLRNVAALAGRMMVIQRVIKAPRRQVWNSWMNAAALPQWWGPEGFTCRTTRIDLREGGEWVFDMIGPDGTVFPNHHLYKEVIAETRIGYTLLWGENGPKHADAWVSFENHGGATQVTLCMALSSEAELQQARQVGAAELGQQTLAKLEKFISAH